MKSKITIAGLGSGKADELTLGVLKALEEAEQVILRTGRHGIASFLKKMELHLIPWMTYTKKVKALTASILR